MRKYFEIVTARWDVGETDRSELAARAPARARRSDPVALGAWYRECLGLDADENGLWRQEAGPTVFATFESETDYFGSRAQQAMINFRVRDLDGRLAQLPAQAADVAGETRGRGGGGLVGAGTAPRAATTRRATRACTC